ncbi:carbonic anhydrase 1-like [Sycon ciliatum]|uniref:carbonic anhydrase 1-like n=1 Tax=Sycon ciliatum TaxID=27933 RepID=UPI0031F6BECC
MEVVLLLSLCITAVWASGSFSKGWNTGATTRQWSYNLDSPMGPAGWGNIAGFETCGNGTEQSPINIPTASAAYMTYPALNVMSSPSKASFHFHNNGAAADADPTGATAVNITGGPLGSEQYSIHNFHIHFGNSTFMSSEHSVDSSRTAGELHVVFFKSTYSTLGEALDSGDGDALAVISMLFNVGSDASSAHPGLETILRHFSNLTYPEDGVEQSIDFATLLRPSDLTSFYTYNGSLTTPGCNEQVVWMVMSQVQNVLPTSLNSLSGLRSTARMQTPVVPVFGNARPLQSLDNRMIYRNFQMTPSRSPPTIATSSASGPTVVSLVALFLSVLAIYANLL